MDFERTVSGLPALLKELREERRISLRQLADHARVSPSVVRRAEGGATAKLSTWDKLFAAMGYYVNIEALELSEEASDLLEQEKDARSDRQQEGLCAGKRRFY